MFPILAAEVAQPPSVLIEKPEWLRMPDGADIARNYPEHAQKTNVEGRAVVVCQVGGEGKLTNCFVADENPKGENFGDATLRLTQFFRVKAIAPDGAPAAGRWVKLPLAFRLPRGPGEDTTEFVGAQACYGQVTKLAEDDSITVEMWQASLYWYAKIAQAVANNGGRPSQVENYAAAARSAAQQGRLTVPKGWELESCLAKTAK